MINYVKSVLVPSTKMQFLGFVEDSITLSLALPRDKIRNVRKECQTLLDLQLVTVRQLARLLGCLTSTIQAVFPGPLHYHHLQKEKNRALGNSPLLHYFPFPSGQRGFGLVEGQPGSMEWKSSGFGFSRQKSPVIETDASQQGWGAFCNGVFTGGPWSLRESLFHVYCLELLAGASSITDCDFVS